ncbi:fibrous sheath-interacting protein 1 isoform X3 [Etheostoma spectabile]|uniref:fibrous sheath-interacting protein 1 isoform X3 n=1 Tax=Etheostoma spectabile TaxID=54343 RepID=UPI0013AFDD13|nr:fibrous sheath-interacting protein 1 isoform X3 [Etheostoma spectabile]
MEIIRGNLDDISRPASSELTGSRVSSVSMPHNDRIGSTTPFALVVLTNEAADIQTQSSSEETIINSSASGPAKGQCHIEVTDEQKEGSKLQRAIEEMRQLDEILSAKICIEKEVKRQRKEVKAKLWQELQQNMPEGHSECAQEAMNTRLFLALEALTGTEEEDDFVPVFETQVPDSDHIRDSLYLEQSEKRPDSLTESFEIGHEETRKEQFEGSHCGASKGKKKQKDFVKRNIELVSGEVDQVLMTQAEKERLAELLREVDEEDGARGADREGRGSEVGWKCDGDPQPREQVPLDIKERRGQERRLREIQQQLEILGQDQEMTNESPDLTEEQLLSLLDGCELTESRTQDLETNDTTRP